MRIRIIAALNKKNEYLYLNDVLDSYKLDEKLKAREKSKQKSYLKLQQMSLMAILLIC